MQIGLRLDPLRQLRWHQWLAAALCDMPGCRVSIVFAAAARPLPLACRLLLQLERLIYRCRTDHAMELTGVPGFTPHGPDGDKQHDFDVVVDLSGSDDPLPRCRRALTPLFNDVAGELGAIAAILNGPPMRIEVHDSARGAASLTALPAVADPRMLTSALDGVLSSTATLILKAIDQPAVATTGNGDQPPPPHARNALACSTTLAQAGRALRDKVVARIGRIVAGGHSWAVGCRVGAASSLLDRRRATFALLLDDRRRYYADPFPFRYRGRSYLFVEEFGFACDRGCISVSTLEANGALSRPRAIIEEPHHLSYPLVFEHDGEIWMIPESGAANRIDVYRAEQFPDRWRREGTLLEGVAAYDATLTRHDGKLWLLVTMARWNSTSWDDLSIFHASRLAGPWIPHTHNPVLLDARRSRSGGALFRRDGALLRPVQDCSRIYGGALAFGRVDVLSETDFRQTEIGRIACGGFGCHTYNRHGAIEAIDIFGGTLGLERVEARYVPAGGATRLPGDGSRQDEQALLAAEVAATRA